MSEMATREVIVDGEKLDPRFEPIKAARIIRSQMARVAELEREREQLLDHIASLVRAALKIEAALGVAINQRNEAERFANENYDLIGYWRDLFKCANAAKRKARTDARVLRAYGVE